MWLNAGIVRSRQSLNRALETIMERKDVPAIVETPGGLIRLLEFRNMRLIGEMVCRSALTRTESRGSHFRSDYPGENNDDWRVNIQVRLVDSGLVFEQVQASGVDPASA
jgi:L-aspartate oxidase